MRVLLVGLCAALASVGGALAEPSKGAQPEEFGPFRVLVGSDQIFMRVEYRLTLDHAAGVVTQRSCFALVRDGRLVGDPGCDEASFSVQRRAEGLAWFDGDDTFTLSPDAQTLTISDWALAPRGVSWSAAPLFQ